MTSQSSNSPEPERTLSSLDETLATPENGVVPLPQRVGRYHVRRIIAVGGMGTVYEATQDQPRRVVALKVMKHGIASRSALRRFEYESQILARLHHPGIAQVYEAGTHDDGSGPVPYFAMEYIPAARTITAYAREKKAGHAGRAGADGQDLRCRPPRSPERHHPPGLEAGEYSGKRPGRGEDHRLRRGPAAPTRTWR